MTLPNWYSEFDDSLLLKRGGSGNLYDCPFFYGCPGASDLSTKTTKAESDFYIDGLNLYCRAVRSTPALKWLDIARYCELLRSHDDIRVIR